MDKLSVIQADHDAAAPFQGPLADWFRGKRTLAELLPEAFAAHRIASQAELVAEVERLRSALESVLTAPMIDHQNRDRSAYGIARKALSHTKGESK